MAIEKWIQLDSVRIHYFVAGERGSPVVLLHGGGTDSALLSWRLVIPALAQVFCVYAPDWPGYGGSSPLSEEHTTEAMIGCLGRLLDEWQLLKATLVGVSMGGAIALGYTLAHPERVGRLVLVDSYGLHGRAPFQWLSHAYLRVPWLTGCTWAMLRRSRLLTRLSLGRIFHDKTAVTDELVEEVFQAIRNSRAELAFYSWQKSEVLCSGLRTSYVDRLPRIGQPTLIVHGEKDNLVPVAAASEAVRRLPNAHLEVVSACGHWPQREKPEHFNRTLLAFLERETGDHRE